MSDPGRWNCGYTDSEGRTVILRESADGTKVVGDDIPEADARAIVAAYNALLSRLESRGERIESLNSLAALFPNISRGELS